MTMQARMRHLLDKDNCSFCEGTLTGCERAYFPSIKSMFFRFWEVSGILNYVFDKPDLWAVSRFALTKRWGNRAGAVHFGLTFQKAIEKLTKSGNPNGAIIIVRSEKFSDGGRTADMLASDT